MPAAIDILRQYWGYEAFRPMQSDIIQSVLQGQDTLALLPTGGGKSICFQVPAMCMQGMALVVSPLIALMKDQVERLNQLGIAATYVNSSMPRRLIDQKLQMAMDGAYKFLYLAPERILSDMFQLRLERMPLNLLAVDEAHCISQWGYDFRPAYLEISRIRELRPQLPVIALTASATPRVEADILEQLHMRQARIFRKSFYRENLRYFVLHDENVLLRITEIIRRTRGTGIVYARTRRRCERIGKLLNEQGIAAAVYHGGMKNSERNAVQQDWLDGKSRIMVATNAFGMGIDKPDVRFVLHYNLPFDLESYYQEAGRGGRDGQTALAIAFYNPVDIGEMKKWQAGRYPSWQQVKTHYEQLCNFYHLLPGEKRDAWQEFDMPALVAATGSPAMALYRSIKLLEQEGLLQLNEDSDDFSYIQVICSPQDVLLYKSQHPPRQQLIDFMLRKLGGEVYTQEKRFLLPHWARELGSSPEELHQRLERLARYGLIFYQAARSHPVIRFPQARHQLSKQGLNWDKYTFLRQQSEARLQAMLQYAENTEVCRSLMIQHYFGEQSHQPCGRCDVCLGRHKTQVSGQEFQHIRRSFLALLKKSPLTYREALTRVQAGTPSQREKVLRYLIDKQVIRANPHGQLELP
ncbi:MAG: RecQ family ATP-dependent DNA helicase [Bacteroidetes bacterium]|nr:MAG: RecQ family ATP-dependent DNA helicase [Bacteroidota bacterium]